MYDGVFARVRIDRVRMPDGEVRDREVVEQADAAGIVPIFADGSVMLLRQYRQPFAAYLLEIPAGKLDRDGEDPAAAAARELIEETGYRAGQLEHLITFRNSAGWTDESTHLYVATGPTAEGVPDDFHASAEEADMEIVRLPLEEALTAVRDGTITDAKTVIGLLLVGAGS